MPRYIAFDPFGAYIDGREYAIDRNWNDRNQYNKVVGDALNNDAARLRNWLAEDTYQDQLVSANSRGRLLQNQAFNSQLSSTLNALAQPGAESLARLGSQYQTALAQGLQPTIPNVVQGQVSRTLGQATDMDAQGQALQSYAMPTRNAQASNNITALDNAGAQLLADQAYIQPETAARRQAAINYYNGLGGVPATAQQTIPQQVQQAGQPSTTGATQPMTQAGRDVMSTVYVQGSRIPVGQMMTLNINGTPQQVGRDESGVYIIVNGNKLYAQAPNTAPVQNSVYQW